MAEATAFASFVKILGALLSLKSAIVNWKLLVPTWKVRNQIDIEGTGIQEGLHPGWLSIHLAKLCPLMSAPSRRKGAESNPVPVTTLTIIVSVENSPSGNSLGSPQVNPMGTTDGGPMDMVIPSEGQSEGIRVERVIINI